MTTRTEAISVSPGSAIRTKGGTQPRGTGTLGLHE